MALHKDGILVVIITTLLTSASGTPIISVVSNPSQYGFSETLKCTDPSNSSGKGYIWRKDGAVIFSNTGEENTIGKYSASNDGTTLKLVIKDIVVSDEGIYTCNTNFAESNRLALHVESRGTVSAELTSSNLLEVTFRQIYPNTISAIITCDSNTVSGSFVRLVADGDRFTQTWKSTNTFSTEPSSCDASFTLRTFSTVFSTAFSTAFNAAFSSTSISTTATPSGRESYTDKPIAQSSSILSQSEGDTVTLSCSLLGSFTFPEWRGPPSLTLYTYGGDKSGSINPAAPAASRLQYASNNRDLILSNAAISDFGDYQCTSTGLGDHTITLTFTKEIATSSAPDVSSTSTSTITTSISRDAMSSTKSSTPIPPSETSSHNLPISAATVKTETNVPGSNTVIIVSSVGGGLFIVGMVIMVLHRRKRDIRQYNMPETRMIRTEVNIN